MKKTAAASFKVHCFALLNQVQTQRETVLITKRGKPVAKLVPVERKVDEIYDFLAGRGAIAGDIVSPVLSHEWKRKI